MILKLSQECCAPGCKVRVERVVGEPVIYCGRHKKRLKSVRIDPNLKNPQRPGEGVSRGITSDRLMKVKECRHCDKKFETKHPVHHFCSRKCREKDRDEKRKKANPPVKIDCANSNCKKKFKKFGTRRYCSEACKKQAFRQRKADKALA